MDAKRNYFFAKLAPIGFEPYYKTFSKEWIEECIKIVKELLKNWILILLLKSYIIITQCMLVINIVKWQKELIDCSIGYTWYILAFDCWIVFSIIIK